MGGRNLARAQIFVVIRLCPCVVDRPLPHVEKPEGLRDLQCGSADIAFGDTVIPVEIGERPPDKGFGFGQSVSHASPYSIPIGKANA